MERYCGEFGYDLALHLPFLYWLHRRGRLTATASVAGTRELYYFSPDHTVLPGERSFQKAPGANPDFSRARFDLTEWCPPPYKDRFAGDPEALAMCRDPAKPLLIVHNKHTREWDGPPVNFLGLPLLADLLSLLAPSHTIVYIRPGGLHTESLASCACAGYTGDHNDAVEFGDHALLRQRFPDVHIFQDLLAASAHDYNGLQLRLHAECDRFVSVQGGNAVMASYFGGTNLVYAVRGPEVRYGTFQTLYPRLSGCTVVQVGAPSEMLREAAKRFTTRA